MTPDSFVALLGSSDPHARALAMRGLAEALVGELCDPPTRDNIACLLTAGLDDPSPIVRCALSEVLADARSAPYHLIVGLARDQLDVAKPIILRSALIRDHDLVDLVGEGEARTRVLIARRPRLSAAVAAALVEVGERSAVQALLANPSAAIARRTYRRLGERFARIAEIRSAMLGRADLPLRVRHDLVMEISEALGNFVAERAWLPAERARRTVREASEKASVELMQGAELEERTALVGQLAATGRLTPSLLIRALSVANLALVEEALTFLSGMPRARVAALMRDPHGLAFAALMERAGIPPDLRPGMGLVLDVVTVSGKEGVGTVDATERRRLIERILTRYQGFVADDLDYLLGLLTRFATEAAREEARDMLLVSGEARAA